MRYRGKKTIYALCLVILLQLNSCFLDCRGIPGQEAWAASYRQGSPEVPCQLSQTSLRLSRLTGNRPPPGLRWRRAADRERQGSRFEFHGAKEKRKRPASICSRVFLVGCPVGLEPTVSRSTIWRVNRLRYGHHINAPEGTRTPGPLLRRQLLYPPELRAHVVIPMGSDMVCSRESLHAARSIIP